MGTAAHIHPAPTNIINSVKGWNTRHIYNYYGTTNTTDFNYTSIVSEDYSQNLFQVINDYQTSDLTVYKGVYTFPPRYFRSGKDLIIKAFLYIDTDTYTDGRLQLNVGINNTKTTYVVIGASNKGSFHTFGDGITQEAFIEAEIVCRGIETLDKPPKLTMMATGYIRYDTELRKNETNYLIPIVPLTTTLATVDSDVTTAVENTINLNFSGSRSLKSLNVLNLSIEERE
jgi:hypothetical protein